MALQPAALASWVAAAAAVPVAAAAVAVAVVVVDVRLPSLLEPRHPHWVPTAAGHVVWVQRQVLVQRRVAMQRRVKWRWWRRQGAASRLVVQRLPRC